MGAMKQILFDVAESLAEYTGATVDEATDAVMTDQDAYWDDDKGVFVMTVPMGGVIFETDISDIDDLPTCDWSGKGRPEWWLVARYADKARQAGIAS